jgi:hypothetical protein
MCAEPVPLSVLALDLDTPAVGWVAELNRRGVAVIEDDLGRQAIDRSSARAIYSEHFESEARKARKAQELEAQLVAADELRRALLPKGIPANEVPPGMSPAGWLMATEPVPAGRVSVVEDALAGSGTIYHPLGGEES